MARPAVILASLILVCSSGPPVGAVVLWSDLGTTVAYETGAGSDILGGVVRRDDTAADALYFKFHLNPLSDVTTEEYFAGFQLFEGDTGRLGVGNSLKAWAYCAYNTSEIGESNRVFGDFDLRTSQPESYGIGTFFNYELPRRGVERTVVFKVQYIPGGDDRVTVWLNPDLSPNATEAGQSPDLTTKFKANASFNQIRLQHGGGGKGWIFSDMAIATSFNDLVTQRSVENTSSTHVTFLSWQREQGLPQNSVLALAQSADGYLWIGTEDGLARFDGVRFVAFGMKDGVPNGPVGAVMEDSHRTLWIGTVGSGLVCRRNGRFTTYTARDGLPSDTITALAEDSEGKIWIGTEAGLAIWDGNSFGTLEAAEAIRARAITTLFRDRSGTMWIGARGAGVFHFLAGKFKPVTDEAADDLLKDPHAVLVDQSVRLWIAAGDDFVLCREGQQWRRFRIARHLARPYVSALAEEPDGTVWAGSMSEGLVVFAGGKIETITASAGLSDNFVESMLVDREGNLWVGTAAGLNRLRHSNLSVSGPNEGLGEGAVQGLAEIAPGVMWAAKASDGLYESQGRGFSQITTAADLPRRYPEVNALLTTRDGACWVGCSQGLLHFQDPKSPTEAEVEFPSLPDVNVVALAADGSNGVWAGTRDGVLWRMADGTWAVQTNFSQPHAITALAQGGEGSLWIGTEGGGLYRFKDGVLDHIDQSKGLSSGVVRALYLDAAGTIWIGTAGGGLCWLRGTNVNTCTSREGMPDNTISQILEDDSGRLWLGSNRGIACVTKSELEDLAAGKITAVYPQIFGRAEGMPSEECTGGFFPAGLKTKSGQLWFSTMKGIVVADPRQHPSDEPAPAVLLEEVVVNGGLSSEFRVSGFDVGATNSVAGAGDFQPGRLNIPPGQHRVEFRYTAPSFIAPERIRFRYKLEGLDADWIPAGTQRSAFYNYLPPGQYRFRVMAGSEGVWNEHGAGLSFIWNEHGAGLSFNVLTYFWQTTWFRIATGLGLLAIAGGTVRVLEKRKLHRRLEQLEQERVLERERARIAQDLHDDLGSSLAHISLLSSLVKADKEQPGLVDKHADKIFKSADQTVRALEEIVWAVRPGGDTLQSLVEYIAHFANELFEGNRTRCRLDLPHDLPALTLLPEIRHNMFLVVKEALTNALKHADATEVRVGAKADANTLEIVVQDDGKGFHPPSHFVGKKKRNGLGNMRHRAETIGGRIEFKTAPGQGTEVRLIVSLNSQTGGKA
jgi:ligand-binding sensor domain-containing protein/signal transduction histidine kinase